MPHTYRNYLGRYTAIPLVPREPFGWEELAIAATTVGAILFLIWTGL